MPALGNCSPKFLVLGPSTDPKPRNGSFIFLLRAVGSANAPLDVLESNPDPPKGTAKAPIRICLLRSTNHRLFAIAVLRDLADSDSPSRWTLRLAECIAWVESTD